MSGGILKHQFMINKLTEKINVGILHYLCNQILTSLHWGIEHLKCSMLWRSNHSVGPQSHTNWIKWFMADEYIYNNNHWLLNYGGGKGSRAHCCNCLFSVNPMDRCWFLWQFNLEDRNWQCMSAFFSVLVFSATNNFDISAQPSRARQEEQFIHVFVRGNWHT